MKARPPRVVSAKSDAARPSWSRRRLRSSAALASARARSISAARSRSCTPARYAVIRSRTAPAWRGRSGGSAARQSRARATSSASAPQASSRAQGLGRVAAGGLALGLGRGPAGERGRAGQDLAEDRAQGEDVGPLVHRVDLAPGLLRRHVGRACPAPSRPATAPRPGRRSLRRGDDRLAIGLPAGGRVIGDPAAGQHLGQAPVHDLDLAERADHDVRRLQVPVDHPSGVRVGHRLRHLLEDAQGPRQPVGRRRPGGQQLREGLAPDQLHREERPAVGEGAQLVDRHDARVLELAADLRLLDEAADHLGAAAEVVAEDLDGDVAAEVGVAALEHLAHAAAGDLAVDAVADRRVGGGPVGRPDDGRLGTGVGVAQQDARHRADGGGERLQDAGAGEVDAGAELAGVREAQRGAVEPLAQQAAGAVAAGGVGGALGAAARAAVGGGGGHEGGPPMRAVRGPPR